MNNFQHIVKNDTRAAMHMAVELCEQGDFDSVTDAFRWLLQEHDDATLSSGKLTAEQVREVIYKNSTYNDIYKVYQVSHTDMQAITDELNASLGGVE